MHRPQLTKLIRAGRSVRGPWRVAAVAVVLAGAAGAGVADYASGTSGGYVVRAGDSLWAIATAHGTTVAALAAANDLDPTSILPIGRHLYIPSASSSSSSNAVEAAAVASTATLGSGSFCSGVVASSGPYGVLPSLLAASPDRLALRPLFEEWASHYGVSLPLLEAVDWQESGWQQSVVSSTGAVGVGQIMPATGAFIANALIGLPMNLQSVSDNIRMSAAFLAYLAHVEGGNRCATIAAYYEGPVNLAAAGVYPSTQQYVADVEALVPRFE